MPNTSKTKKTDAVYKSKRDFERAMFPRAVAERQASETHAHDLGERLAEVLTGTAKNGK